MRQYLNVAVRLMAICAVAALALALVNAVTAPQIARVQQQRLEEALEAVSLGYNLGTETDIEHPHIQKTYRLTSDDNEKIGYIVNLHGMGYAGDLHLLVSYSLDGEVLASKLMQNQETPGLGKEAENEWYMEKFVGTGTSQRIPVSKTHLNANQADAISGSTITFIGIGQAILEGSNFVKGIRE